MVLLLVTEVAEVVATMVVLAVKPILINQEVVQIM